MILINFKFSPKAIPTSPHYLFPNWQFLSFSYPSAIILEPLLLYKHYPYNSLMLN